MFEKPKSIFVSQHLGAPMSVRRKRTETNQFVCNRCDAECQHLIGGDGQTSVDSTQSVFTICCREERLS